MQQFYAI